MIEEIINEIKERYPEVPFLALGQTVLWDEPTKIALKYWFDKLYPEAKFTFGVHNTDYFAKSPLSSKEDAYLLVTHNDNSTRDLWASTLEISRPFGSEIHPTIRFFRECNIPLDVITPVDRRSEFLDEITSCWGWMSVVKSGTRSIVACDVKLRDVLDRITELITWGTCGARDLIGEKGYIKDFCDDIRGFILDYADKNPSSTITDLFKELYKWFWEKLLGYMPQNVELSSSVELFRFNTDTYKLPRFSILELFIDPSTREICKEIYNKTVETSGIYTLDKFGFGAIPFDLVIPGRERGTICIQPRTLLIEGEELIRIPLERPVESLKDLTEVLERNFGKDVAIVGKAVPLLSMIRSEFILVFNERGSGYYDLTLKMERLLEENGINLRFYPILRLRYKTWDVLDRIDEEINLPEYMRLAFKKDSVSSGELSLKWKDTVDEEEKLIYKLSATRKPREIMKLLEERTGGHWGEKLLLYNSLKDEIISKRKPIEANWEKVRSLKDRLKETRDMFERRVLTGEIRRLRDETWRMEKAEEIKELRRKIKEIELEVEMAKLNILRSAFLVKENLPYTNFRPSAWWFIAMDPTREWFKGVIETLEVYTEGERCRDYNLQRCRL
ncbi:TPA: hypothetical protein GXX44_00065 [bacterium]|nr:hypothetical protein [bacterium]